MNQAAIRVRSVFGLGCVAVFAVALRSGDRGSAATAPDSPKSQASEPSGTVTTLYYNDPVDKTLDLRTGGPGHVVQDHEVKNRNSHLVQGYHPDCLTVGIQGGEQGAIVDLGSAKDLAAAYSFSDTGNGGRGFTSIRFHNGALVVRSDLEPDHVQPLRESETLRETDSLAHALAKTGHIYLVRVVSTDYGDIYAKLIVLDYQPGVRTTIRWQKLDP